MKATISSATLFSLLLVSTTTASLITKKHGHQTLVLLDDWATIETHSTFFDSLRKDGHELLFETANPAPPIKYYEEYFYDNIILMAPAVTSLKDSVSTKELIEYLEANHNLMIFGDIDAEKPVRSLVNQFGVEFENAGYEVRDYTQETQSEQLNVVTSRNFFEPFKSQHVFSQHEKPIAFSGIGQVLDSKNHFVFPILRAEASTFSFNAKKGEISKVSGDQLTLVSGYQTRGNQRVIVSGSLGMCSNAIMQQTIGGQGGLENSANFRFCQELYQWAFQQRGVLRLTNMRHHKVGESWTGVNPENYRIKDEVVLLFELEEKKADGTYVPFAAKDVQLEFLRLDPFHRVNMKQQGTSATYAAQIEVPDTLGIYKFRVSHWRYGFSFIEAETLVSCIQFRHDEYPRFLNIAVPYYFNVFMLMGAGFLFIVFFLYSDIDTRVHKKLQ